MLRLKWQSTLILFLWFRVYLYFVWCLRNMNVRVRSPETWLDLTWWKDKKERSFHNGCITCSRNSKHDNRRRQLRTVLSEFQKRYLNQILEFALESYSRVLQSGHSVQSLESQRSHWDPSVAYRYRTAVAQMYSGICDRVIIRFAFLERPFLTNYESFALFIHNT